MLNYTFVIISFHLMLHAEPEWGLVQHECRYAVSIVDALVIPTDLTPGEYVLGFRYDCEATAQVWSSCADIEIA